MVFIGGEGSSPPRPPPPGDIPLGPVHGMMPAKEHTRDCLPGPAFPGISPALPPPRGGVGEKGMVYEMMPAKSKIGAGAGSAEALLPLSRPKTHAADSRLSATISRTSTAIVTSRSQVLRAARRAGMSLAVTPRTSVSSPASLTRTDDLSPTSPASWQTEWYMARASSVMNRNVAVWVRGPPRGCSASAASRQRRSGAGQGGLYR